MPEQPDKKLHRNRINSIPTMGDGGPLNTFSRSDFLTGISPCRYASSQHPDIFVDDERSILSDDPTPDLWPALWPLEGKILSVPKCVIISTFICWPEFWETGQVDFPRDVIGELLTTGRLGNYYYLDQWDYGKDWRNNSPPTGGSKADFRYARTILNLQNPYYAFHRYFCGVMERLKADLESGPDPIHVIYPEWIPCNNLELTRGHSVTVGHSWTYWMNNDVYWPQAGEADPNVQAGIGNCDVWISDGSRDRVRPDPTCPNWRSRANDPPDCPPLLSNAPYFGTNVLHLWLGHFCVNRGGSSHTMYETYPLSPGGTQLGTLIIGNYLGSNIPFFDGKREIWRDLGLNYGYMGGYEGVYNYHQPIIKSAADQYKQNFWKYRNFGLRLCAFENLWDYTWQVDQIRADQKWCPSQQFYFGFSLEEFSALVQTEDSYFIDYSEAHGGLKFGNIMQRFPDSPSIRDAINVFFPLLRTRFEGYYNGIDQGTYDIYKKIIDDNGLADYNVEALPPGTITDADSISEYVRAYFKDNP